MGFMASGSKTRSKTLDDKEGGSSGPPSLSLSKTDAGWVSTGPRMADRRA